MKRESSGGLERGRSLGQRGSAVMFALFACVTVMVVVQMLSVAVVCCERAMADEVAGRTGLAAVDAALAGLRSQGRVAWGPMPWTPVQRAERSLEARVTTLPEGQDWVLRAEVAGGTAEAHRVTGALMERGRDGLDLPMAALVARCVRVTEGRATPWLRVTEAGDGSVWGSDKVVAYVDATQGPQLMDEGCSVSRLETAWSLGEGWVASLECGTVAGPDVILLKGEKGRTVRPELADGLGTSDRPALLVVTGGADLDARGVGEIWGVLVAEGASVLLDGAVVHGAVFAGETADFDVSGQLVFDAGVSSWARDRCFDRTRLVPGTRSEDTG